MPKAGQHLHKIYNSNLNFQNDAPIKIFLEEQQTRNQQPRRREWTLRDVLQEISQYIHSSKLINKKYPDTIKADDRLKKALNCTQFQTHHIISIIKKQIQDETSWRLCNDKAHAHA